MGFGFLFVVIVAMWFYGVGLLAPSTILNVEDQGIHFFVWGVTFDFCGMGGPTSNYANACIALGITTYN